MAVYVLGAGIMGSQIAAEYALGGHRVTIAARDRSAARRRVAAAFELSVRHGLARPEAAEDAAVRVDAVTFADGVPEDTTLVVEAVVEDRETKVALLRPVAAAATQATFASNTSSLSITELGRAIGAPERTLGTHYWNPPLLMPLVEVVRGGEVDSARLETVTSDLRDLGKTPVLVERDVPGFVWNRLQFALLREALAIVDAGVADATTVDTVVREGLARRWRFTGPFQTAALGGAQTFGAVAANLFPDLSTASQAPGLAAAVDAVAATLDGAAERRNRGLAAEMFPEPERWVRPSRQEELHD